MTHQVRNVMTFSRLRFVVVFADGNQTRTAYLDRAVRRLTEHTVTEIRHTRRTGVLTVTADGTVLLSEADPRSVRRWQRDADTADVVFSVNSKQPEGEPRPPMAEPSPATPAPVQRHSPFRKPGEPFRRVVVLPKGSFDPFADDPTDAVFGHVYQPHL